jgi:hypothetical protein
MPDLFKTHNNKGQSRMERIVTALLILMTVSAPLAASQNIIPADRRTEWTPGVTVGVPGGIPNRVTIGATVDAAKYGTGLIDASAAIGAAIDSCPSGRVVYIPAGTYRLDDRIYRAYASNITIRGAGMGMTILKSNTGQQALLLGTADWPRPTSGIAITGGATKGGTALTLAEASTIAIGKLVRIEQNDLPYVISATAPVTNNKLMAATFRVSAKAGNIVTVTPPLPVDFTSSPALVQYAISPLTNTGVEDLTIDCNAMSWTGLEFDQSWGCWVKNVEIKNSTGRQMFLVCFVSGEIRHNYTHDVVGGGPNHEGIDLYQDGSFNLIEDNITYNGGFPGIILGDSQGGCSGNVIAYNFCYSANTGASTMAGMDISVSHGPHNMMNLVEGNIAGGMGSDGYFGSTSHITMVRNWFTATHPTATDNLIAVNIGRWNTYFNLVGNILGTSSFSRTGQFQPVTSFGYGTQVIYKLGFPNMGNNGFSMTWGPTIPPDYTSQSAHQPGGDSHGNGGNTLQELDLNVAGTMIRHGNYDYLRGSIAWDTSIVDHTIPSSYFRTGKPSYFGGLAWPPCDPASPPGAFNDSNISRIPAGYRFVHGTDPTTSVPTYDGGAPARSALLQNYPNPFNPSTTIRFQVQSAGDVRLAVYDMLGREVALLLNEKKSAGNYQVTFDAPGLSSGVYIYRLAAGSVVQSCKMLLIR